MVFDLSLFISILERNAWYQSKDERTGLLPISTNIYTQHLFCLDTSISTTTCILKVACHRCLTIHMFHAINRSDIIDTQSPFALSRVSSYMPNVLIRLCILVVFFHLHLSHFAATKLCIRVLSACGREQIDEEREDVEGKDECDCPFQHRGCIVQFAEITGCEGDGEDYF